LIDHYKKQTVKIPLKGIGIVLIWDAYEGKYEITLIMQNWYNIVNQ